MFDTKRFFSFVKIGVMLVFLLTGSFIYPQGDSPSNNKKIKIKHLVCFFPIYSLYKNDPNLTTNTKGKIGFGVSYKTEFITGKKLNYVAGVDFVGQTVLFKGYYSAPLHTYVFDQTFAYTHTVNTQEIQLPLGIRFFLLDKPINNYAPYFTGGIKFRYLFKTYTVIKDDSTNIYLYKGTKPGSMTFESRIPSPKINTCLQAGFGIQRNHEEINGAIFFEITFNYGISRFEYSGYNNSNNLGIRNAFVTFAFGWKL